MLGANTDREVQPRLVVEVSADAAQKNRRYRHPLPGPASSGSDHGRRRPAQLTEPSPALTAALILRASSSPEVRDRPPARDAAEKCIDVLGRFTETLSTWSRSTPDSVVDGFVRELEQTKVETAGGSSNRTRRRGIRSSTATWSVGGGRAGRRLCRSTGFTEHSPDQHGRRSTSCWGAGSSHGR
jgi:hypothetical protein